MKKILFILVLALMLLVSCSEEKQIDNTPKNDVPVEESTDFPKEYVVKARTFDEIYALSHEEKAKEFLAALCLGDKEILEYYMYGDTLDILLECQFDAFIKDTEEIPFGYCSTVMLNVKKGVENVIPAGKYEYTLVINEANPIIVGYFGPSERFDLFKNPKTPDTSADYPIYNSYKFIEEFYHSASELSKEALDTNKYFDSIYHMAVHSLMATGTDFTFTTTSDGFKMYMTERFGYTDPDLLDRFAVKLDEDDSAIKDEFGTYTVSCAHGYGSVIYDLIDISEKDDITTFSYVLYSDTARTVQCARMEFDFEKNEQSDVMRVVDIRFEKLCDLTPAVFTV